MKVVAAGVAFLVAVGFFAAPPLLEGDFVYDDAGTVTRNPVVLGEEPLRAVWVRDFWGQDEVSDVASHKSWRPLTTLTFRLNYWLGATDPRGYHLLNAVLHALATALVVPVVALSIPEAPKFTPFASALLFALHPVHAEAVQNITGRAEVLMVCAWPARAVSTAPAPSLVSSLSYDMNIKQKVQTAFVRGVCSLFRRHFGRVFYLHAGPLLPLGLHCLCRALAGFAAQKR